MKTRTILAAFVAAYLVAACAVGTNVMINGNPTAWGTCK